MRILHMVASISPESGGPTELIRMLIRNAPPTDTAEVVTLDDPTAPFLHDLPFKVHALGTTPKRWYSPNLLPWLRANRHRFDAAIIHGLWQYPGLAARLTLKGHIPYAIFPHGMLDPWFKRNRLKHLKKQLYWLLAESWNLRSAHRVLFTTERERNLAQHTFWPSRWNPSVTPLGTEPPPADTATLLAAFHRHCPELKDKRFLLFLGRIDPKKGCDLLVSAFGILGIVHPDVHLVMAGPDPNQWRNELEQFLSGPSSLTERVEWASDDQDAAANLSTRVHWPGLLAGNAKWGAFAACEAFVLPSHQENFGISVVEALASSKPVLISDQINIAPEICEDGCGFVQPDTHEGTLALLNWWLKCSAEQKELMSTRARTTFATRYDMRHNTAAILNIFKAEAN